MSYLILKHLTGSELPAKWTKHLPTGQTFTVSIVAENAAHQPSISDSVTKNKSMYAYKPQWRDNFFDPS
jgi:hypothetical protein